MPKPLAYPEQAHFAQDFALGVGAGLVGDAYPRHPRGQHSPGRYIPNGREGGGLKSQLFRYSVPDGSDTLFPTPQVGDRIYVGRWYPGHIFAGLWIFGSAFTGYGDVKAQYSDATGTVQTLTLASVEEIAAGQDFVSFEQNVVNEASPASHVLDVYLELEGAPAPGDVLKGRLDFVSV